MSHQSNRGPRRNLRNPGIGGLIRCPAHLAIYGDYGVRSMHDLDQELNNMNLILMFFLVIQEGTMQNIRHIAT